MALLEKTKLNKKNHHFRWLDGGEKGSKVLVSVESSRPRLFDKIR